MDQFLADRILANVARLSTVPVLPCTIYGVVCGISTGMTLAKRPWRTKRLRKEARMNIRTIFGTEVTTCLLARLLRDTNDEMMDSAS